MVSVSLHLSIAEVIVKNQGFNELGYATPPWCLKRRIWILFTLLLAPFMVVAQTDPDATIMRAYALEQQDQPASAVALLRPLVDSGTFQGAELGRAWTVLGLAYQDRNDLREAQHAYEQAISILRPMPEEVRDYAAAVNGFAKLYRAQGQFDISISLRLKAVRLYQQIGDHAGVARASQAIASLTLQQGHVKEGLKYLKQTEDEMKATTKLSDDDLATIFSTQAQYARVTNNTSAEIAGYERAIQILKRIHGASSPTLAWEHILLGIAYSDANRFQDALGEMRQGLTVLDRAWGRKDLRYLEAEIAYSEVLNQSGDHKLAASLRATDEATAKEIQRSQCIGCTVSAETLR
jgi:tetratricopeptide (TPR) repeat protein